MMYSYDIECVTNHFSALFIEYGQDKLINEYAMYDIKGDNIKKQEVLNRLNHKLFIIQDSVNDLKALYSFIINNKEKKYFVGFNSTNYDSIMLDYIVDNYKEFSTKSSDQITAKLKNINDTIIGSDLIFFEVRKLLGISKNYYYYNIDLQSINNIHKIPNRISLKQASISIKWYKIEDYEIPLYTEKQFNDLYDNTKVTLKQVNDYVTWDKKIHQDHLTGMIEYLFNDVFITNMLLSESMNELTSRANILSKYGLHVLSSPRSGAADKIMSKLYSDYTGMHISEFKNQRTWRKYINLGNIIHSNVKFRDKVFIKLLTDISNTVIDIYGGSKFNPTVIFKGKEYTLGLGGLHSVDAGGVFTSTDKEEILDADADSYYPISIVKYKIKPKHLSLVIINIISDLVERRLEYKKAGDKTNADIYKIVINSIFGKYGYADSFFKDDQAMYEVTVNNQLYLLMLIEDLELAKFKVISANTDGVTSIVPKDRKVEYYEILNGWSKVTGFTLEVNKYIKYVRTSVNSYIAKIEKGDTYVIKRKGDFDKNKYRDLSSGYYYPIVPRAIEDFYLEGKPIEKTILEGTDILDYCMSQKTGRNFINEEHKIIKGKLYITKLTKTLRFYSSTDGSTLLKLNKEKGTYTNILAGQRVTLLNIIKNVKSIEDYNINYNFYIRKAYNMVDRINNALTTKMKKNTGTLFDNLEDYD
jgi:hypothetical protein